MTELDVVYIDGDNAKLEMESVRDGAGTIQGDITAKILCIWGLKLC
jgi:hypothetical protein